MSDLGNAQLRSIGLVANSQRSTVRRHWRRFIQKEQLHGVPDGCTQLGVRDVWICVFDGRAGGRARAVFDTRDRAIQFAERHARGVTPTGDPLKWEDANTATVSTTQIGDYLVAPLANPY
jgi:hypothetical protein